VWLLKTLPLNVAYPFVGLAFVIVPLLAAFFLDEPLDWRHLAGGALIASGVALASWR
jgi:drug/metabolite transporter (DMT)-like permease